MTKFRLLQITDLHISIPPEDDEIGSRALWMSYQWVSPSRARLQPLQAVADLVGRLRSVIDTIVLSGDIADDGDARNLHCALEFLEARSLPGTNITVDLWPTLQHDTNDPSTFFVTPGNHDRFNGALRIPGGIEFDNIFRKYWTKGIGGVQSLTLHKEAEKLALVTADFCLQGVFKDALNLWGRGKAYAQTMKQLKEETDKCRSEGAAVVWVIHFPPLPDAEKKLRLMNPTAVLDAAEEKNVEYIIAGHLHRNQFNTHGSTNIICTGSAASDFRAHYGNFVRLLEFDVSKNGTIQLNPRTFRYVAEHAQFVPFKEFGTTSAVS